MKLRLICDQCLTELGENISLQIDPSNFGPIYAEEINDDGIYKMTCDKGHEWRVILQEQKFEILFDLGAMALLDGHTREAVSSFAASLERFYEFCIEVILTHNNIDHPNYIRTWKYVKNQSERQLGVFCLLYLLEFNESPREIDQKCIEFRNKVIHKGYIPKYDAVVKYGSYILDYMFEVLIKLRSNHEQSLKKVTMNRIARLYKESEQLGGRPATIGIPTIIHLALSKKDFGQKNFEESLEALKRYRTYTYK